MAVDLLVFNTLNACDALGTPWYVASYSIDRGSEYWLKGIPCIMASLPVHVYTYWWQELLVRQMKALWQHIPSKTSCPSLLEACRDLISLTDAACLVSLALMNSVVYLALQLAIDEVFIFKVLHQDDIIVLLKATRYLQLWSDNFKSLWLSGSNFSCAHYGQILELGLSFCHKRLLNNR
jgi:hypothetical protein